MMRLINLLRGQSRALLALSIFMGILAGVISSIVLAIVNESLEQIGHTGPKLIWLFAGLALLATVAKLVSRLLLMRLATRTIKDLRLRMSDQIVRAPFRDVETNGSGALMATLTEDVARVTEALVALPEQCANAAIAAACFGYLFWLSWPLALVYLGIFAFGILLYHRIAKRAQPAMERARGTWDTLIDHYNGLIDGNKELKLHRPRRNAFAKDGLKPTVVEMMNHSWKWNWILAIASANTQIVFFMLLGTVLFVAPQYDIFDKSVLSGFLLMSLFMGAPISSIVGAMPQFNQADVALRKIDSLGLTLSSADHQDVVDHDAETDTALAPEPIELRGVEYSYISMEDEKTFSLGPIDLKIGVGELIFVIGGNGSGKSSFVKLLAGLYVPAAGAISLGGRSVDDSNRDDYRQNFTVVFSDYHLFRDLYGIPARSLDEKADQYLQSLRLSEKVSIENGKLSTVKLSQGQRKRLALLTAFLENRNIYLFDEWAADQDPVFKHVFYHDILAELKARGKTVIVISHDNHYFDIADRVVRFDNGRIVEDRYLQESEPQAIPLTTV